MCYSNRMDHLLELSEIKQIDKIWRDHRGGLS